MSPLRAKGIGRDFEDEQILFVSFNRCPTDDEMRVIHDLLRGGEDLTEEMVAVACAAFNRAATAEGWKCKGKHKATFIRWMRYALCAALEARKEQTHE